MLLAAMLAMVLVASSPAFAQQTSGAATGIEAVNAAFAGNVAVQQLQNVNSGNVDQDQVAANFNQQIGADQTAVATAADNGTAIAVNLADVDQTQTVDQSITQSQEGISQTNNAIQLANQVLNR
jgi:hypothetical protein